MADLKVTLAEDGRIVIPEEYRRALDWKDGEELVLRLEAGSLRVLALARAIEHAQELVRRYVPEGRSLAQELIAERRAEAASE